jgi:hypothetical protein
MVGTMNQGVTIKQDQQWLFHTLIIAEWEEGGVGR